MLYQHKFSTIISFFENEYLHFGSTWRSLSCPVRQNRQVPTKRDIIQFNWILIATTGRGRNCGKVITLILSGTERLCPSFRDLNKFLSPIWNKIINHLHGTVVYDRLDWNCLQNETYFHSWKYLKIWILKIKT